MNGHGDLNNSFAARPRVELAPEPGYTRKSFAIPARNDDLDVRKRYRPFLLDEAHEAVDWVAELELSTTLQLVESNIINPGQDRLRILVLYGSMRSRLVHLKSSLLPPSFFFLVFSFLFFLPSFGRRL
jgi:arsenic resistance protein ArsH